MREVNFSIPNANKASVGITTALYDRRALDCTSTLPLINSLNHLAYLTTSSPRIRDILTVDGGVERLVCILKDGRSKDLMDMWKWNLAFQCLFNIGVRGSENVRTRVVEADMVPVIATILDNYVKVVDKCREKADTEIRRSSHKLGSSSRHYCREHSASSHSRSDRSRRQVPPPIEIPQPYQQNDAELQSADATPTPAFSLSSPPERTTFRHHNHPHFQRLNEAQTATFNRGHRAVPQPIATASASIDDAFRLRPVRDADRLPSMLPALQAEIMSQPESPTTPHAHNTVRPTTPRPSGTTEWRRRPSIRHQISTSGESDEGEVTDIVPEAPADVESGPEPLVGLQNEINMQEIVESGNLNGNATQVAPPAETGDDETFNITHRAIDGSLPTTAAISFSPAQPTVNVTHPTPPTLTNVNWYPRFPAERSTTSALLAAMPRDEDVLMSLQLLAYVSKYCNLRSFFQQSHLVPRLKIGGEELGALDAEPCSDAHMAEDDDDEEYLLPDDFNIFPLVEKFTVRHHTQDMQYWAGVVMRNLCRKDDARGGIRQCAFYECGRWEEYTRQFAKCRRCRRTKYCSKECQKSAWVYHRHWCVAAGPQNEPL
ncbi:hypothetical protein EJ05DRAFT_16907 [Pseudovirgaria hyperparasitica]|uniref:MYND-type zinc finger protein samB n=1 Tax=Pseudovirgaria hyperparasitica TaxID=470096 RepID=A0A6A6WKX1_9PEZI|nr:uncharacterized protein EJ05DRAFT_16907 [Pseudovirgaria hyperparasitica]KAF2762838.1 hypothetical protein EJ05DRAFT_16907 [Pseudovirgaria hyperparasitica]